mgnify:CR=1 FL=1
MKVATNASSGYWYASRGVLTCWIIPSFTTIMRSDMVRTSFWSCVTKIVVVSAFLIILFSSSRIWSFRSISKLLYGSSSITISGLGARALTRATLCCCPPWTASTDHCFYSQKEYFYRHSGAGIMHNPETPYRLPAFQVVPKISHRPPEFKFI